MCILSETYIFYADVYFIQNFLIKVVVVFLSLYFNKQQMIMRSLKGKLKICVAGAFGTVFEMSWLLIAKSHYLWMIFVQLLEVTVMITFIVGKNKTDRLKLIFNSFLFTMFINAIIEIIWNIWGKQSRYFYALILACGIAVIGAKLWKRYEKIQKGVYEVVFIHAGRLLTLQAFYDSGNKLMDPYTKKGVHIVSESVFHKLQVPEDKRVCVPYQSLGMEGGLIDVYYIDEMCIYGKKSNIKQQKCPIGVTKDNLFEGKNYEMILNEEVL